MDDRVIVFGRSSIEVECLLDLHRDDLGYVVHQRLDSFLFYAVSRLNYASLQGFGLLKAKPEIFLQNIRKLASADGDIARKKRISALEDIDVHR